MYIIGIDLSGPANTKDTSVAAFREYGRKLSLKNHFEHASDQIILDLAREILSSSNLIVGLDAPLSYNPGGGDRPGDKKLRKLIVKKGMSPGSIMPPTMTRMAYLTLRGITIARLLENIETKKSLTIAEVHPGAAMVLRAADLNSIKKMKKSKRAKRELLVWLETQGLSGLPNAESVSDHFIAACACVLAVWNWHSGNPKWMEPANLPHHPYDYIC